MSDYFNMRDRILAESPRKIVPVAPPVVEEPPVHTEKAFVVEGSNGRTYVTGRVTDLREIAISRRAYTKVTGRYVQAEKANLNNCYWTVGDLEYGHPSVAGSPVNVLHDDSKILGCITEAKMITDSVEYGPHMVIEANLWKFLYPGPVDMVEKESAAKRLFLSMETIAEKVQCVSPDGCQESFDYATFMRDKASACGHLAAGMTRRMVNPTFLGVGLILSGVKPGWAEANAEVVREAAHQADMNEMADMMTEEEAQTLVLSVMKWANS